jgi:hypothetical protein
VGFRFNNMEELRKHVSPDIEIVDDVAEAYPGETFGEMADRVAKKEKKPKPSNYKSLEDRFYRTWQELDGPELTREHVFSQERLWRFDFVHLEKKIAFEIQGGMYTANSGHRSFSGVQRDYEKGNAAVHLGWKVFQVTSPMMKDQAYMQALVDFVESA